MGEGQGRGEESLCCPLPLNPLPPREGRHFW